MSDPLVEFVAAGALPQRISLRVALALARRPRGRALLRLLAPADQAAFALLAMGRYEDPDRARELGWDAEAVVARGRELRLREGRP